MAKPKTHIQDPTKDAPKGAAWTLCGLFVLREQVDEADPSCQKCLRYLHSRRRTKGHQAKPRPGE